MKKQFFILCSFIFLFSQQAFAQQQMPQPQGFSEQRLLDRMTRMERDLILLQQQFYQSARHLNEDESDVKPKSISDSVLARLEVRLSEIENRLRQMNGSVEEIQHSNQQLKSKLSTLTDDIEFRFQRLQTAQPKTTRSIVETMPAPVSLSGSNPANTIGTIKQPAQAPAGDPARNLAAQVNPGAPSLLSSSSFGTIESKPTTQLKLAPKGAQTGVKYSSNQSTVDPGPSFSFDDLNRIQAEYDAAFKLLKQSHFDQAEAALKQFVKKNAGHNLVGNAYYWLGETYYVRKQYEMAAVQFLSGYQKVPKGSKAADNLLKLAMSLGQLNKKKEACTSFTKLLDEFPTATNSIRQRATMEMGRIGC